MNAIWDMRKKSVGLLGNMQGDKRPIAFVEDTAVPPENLADYIAEFRAALDARGLTYGMFGHVDAGVLHVRPAIDMKDQAQEGLIREVTEDVVRITQEIRRPAMGRARQGRALRVLAPLLRSALPDTAVDQGGFRSTQPAQPRQDRHPRRRGTAADRRAHHQGPARPHHPASGAGGV